MTATLVKPIKKWTTADVDQLPQDNNRYEIIGGDLFVTRAPDWGHQRVCGNILTELNIWCRKTGLGQTSMGPGIIYTDSDNVIPDLVWISYTRLESLLDEQGHLTGSPELIVEVLSQGKANQQRDQEIKLELYSNQGVQEYWIVDRFSQQIFVYRNSSNLTNHLSLAVTLTVNDQLTSPLLPDFTCLVAPIFN